MHQNTQAYKAKVLAEKMQREKIQSLIEEQDD